ncbi:hypothetical protein [Hoeflea sp. EC-HK425]|uniref:hypothetical protein n=1 Tax=Hoeflea sp. EC-HK425 TaxID=2038388 RepID=UPI001254B029|nr:hypothetical protein [Hoeflea sp. EC-HK425]VVT25172.1 conserved hypothetical protein [Hoeflea sp. EC-HK425]
MDKVPPPPPGIESPPKWADDGKANKEEENWPNESALKGQKAKNSMWALKAVGVVTVLLIFFFVIVFVCSLSFWLFHQMAPTYWHWLNEAQLSKIQSVIFSGAIGAIVSGYVQKHISG